MMKQGLLLIGVLSSSLLADSPLINDSHSITPPQQTVTMPEQTQQCPPAAATISAGDLDSASMMLYDDPAAIEDMLKLLDTFAKEQEKPSMLNKMKLAFSFLKFQLSSAAQSLKDFVASLFTKKAKKSISDIPPLCQPQTK